MARILFAMYAFPGLGGVETVTMNLIKTLGQSHKVYTLAFTATEGIRLPEQLDGAFYFNSAVAQDNAAYFNDIVKRYRITHVINQGMYPFLTDIVFNGGRDTHVKVISVLHGMPGYEKKEYWLQDRIKNSGRLKKLRRRLFCALGINRGYNRFLKMYATCYRMAEEKGDRIVLLCNHYIGEFCRLYNVPRNKITAIPNPVSATYSCLPPPVFEEKENIILYVGRLSAEKNVPQMLDVWKRLQGRLPGWKFIIVGDGPLRPALEKQAGQLENVEFAGYVGNPGEYYRKARLILLMSKYEGYPMSMIEAQRFGTVPVVYDISAGVGSIMEHGGGIVVPENTPEAVAKSVYELANDENRLKSLSLSAYRKSEENKIEAVAGQWQTLFHNEESIRPVPPQG